MNCFLKILAEVQWTWVVLFGSEQKMLLRPFSGASITFANITLANKMEWWNYQIRITSCFDTVYCDRLNQIGE